jgi:hypothetical protein
MITKYANKNSSKVVKRVVVIDLDNIRVATINDHDTEGTLILFGMTQSYAKGSPIVINICDNLKHAAARGRFYHEPDQSMLLREMNDHILTAMVSMYMVVRPELKSVEWSLYSSDLSMLCVKAILTEIGVDSTKIEVCGKSAYNNKTTTIKLPIKVQQQVATSVATIEVDDPLLPFKNPSHLAGPLNIPVPNLVSELGDKLREIDKTQYGFFGSKASDFLRHLGYIVERFQYTPMSHAITVRWDEKCA